MVKKILIADDDIDSLEVTSKILKNEGYEIFSTSSGKECLEIFEKKSPDLCILDIRMPSKDGYETFFEIKEKHPNAKIIFMTAFTVDNPTYRKAKSLGLIYVLMKPFSYDFLKEMVSDVLRDEFPE